MTLVYEDSIYGYEHSRCVWIYFIGKNRYFYREYASDCGYGWFNCGFLDSDEAIEIMLEMSEASDMIGDLL